MHASFWTFKGDTDDLLDSYDGAVAQVPSEAMDLHVCLRTPDGILLVDTCPTEAQARALVEDQDFRRLLTGHGLPEPESVSVHRVHSAIVDGRSVANKGGPGP
jgi:hypothetical protein